MQLPDPIPLTPGGDPTPEEFRYHNVPCSCGELHENDHVTWEMDWMHIATVSWSGEEIRGRYRKCKTCKEWLMQERKVRDVRRV